MTRTRDARLDNLRGILIALVVFGHLIEVAARQNGLTQNLYILIYLFHMPLFVGLSGYLAAPDKSALGAVRPLIIAYLCAELVYRGFDATIFGRGSSYLAPYWLLWFLVSLICWRLLLPIWMRWVPYPVLTAFALGLAAGWVDAVGYPLSVSRTIYFFPFFVIGHVMHRHRIRMDRFKHPIRGAMVIIVVAGAITLLPATYDLRWLYGSLPYSALDGGIVWRLSHYVIALLLCAAVLHLVPQSRTRLTELGQRTLLIFLAHGLIVLMLRHFGFGRGHFVLASAVFLTIAICALKMPGWRAMLSRVRLFQSSPSTRRSR